MIKAREELVTPDILVNHQDVVEWIIGFHAQQIAEKILKAVIIYNGRSPRKTHDLFRLMQELREVGLVLPDWFEELERLDPFAVLLRYETVHLAADWDRDDARSLANRVYDWGATLMGHAAYENYEDFEQHDGEEDGGENENNKFEPF